jgi:sodium-coupled monocarboxylate transporter 8/12
LLRKSNDLLFAEAMDVPKTSVEYVGIAMQRFGLADYLVFVSMLLVCAIIGVYYGFFAGKVSEADYLVGGRNMQTFPVAMSLIARYVCVIYCLI